MEGYRSGKQRRAEIKSARRVRRLEARKRCAMMALVPIGPVVRVDYNKLMASNSYGLSEFAQRGYYVDRAFSCCDCGAECVWTAEQQRSVVRNPWRFAIRRRQTLPALPPR
jgi:hypothetical protein